MTMFTAEQHHWMAANILANAGKPGYPSKERGEQMARNHEIMAMMIEHRQRVCIEAPARAPAEPPPSGAAR